MGRCRLQHTCTGLNIEPRASIPHSSWGLEVSEPALECKQTDVVCSTLIAQACLLPLHLPIWYLLLHSQSWQAWLCMLHYSYSAIAVSSPCTRMVHTWHGLYSVPMCNADITELLLTACRSSLQAGHLCWSSTAQEGTQSCFSNGGMKALQDMPFPPSRTMICMQMAPATRRGSITTPLCA